MRFSTLTTLVLVLASVAKSQTTGVPCCNDLTINAFGSGTTSCTKYVNPPASPLVFSVSASGTATAIYFAVSLCPCAPGFAVIPGCCGALNFIDLNLNAACPFFLLGPYTPVLNSAGCGIGTFTVPFCPTGLSFAIQAAIIDPSCSTGVGLTQAYDVCCL